MKYKVGDKVLIKDIGWYNDNKNILGNVECGDALMTFEKARFCGKIVTISNVSDITDTYGIEEDNGLWRWTDEMIEGLVEEGTKSEPKFNDEDKIYPWTIQDAKDGDVIFYDDGWTCIFKCIHGIWFSSYCFITDEGEFYTGYERHAVDSTVNGNAHLATKEQCNLLFQKIKEAGYKWNPETKTLEKLIEPKFREYSDNEPLDVPTMTTDFVKEHGLPCPEGYIFKDENGNVINATKIVLEKKTVEEKYSDVKIQIFGNVVILKGGINADNPTEYMNEVVHYILNLLGNPKHNQFIEDYLDNPWVRILIFDFNSMEFNNSFDDIINKFN